MTYAVSSCPVWSDSLQLTCLGWSGHSEVCLESSRKMTVHHTGEKQEKFPGHCVAHCRGGEFRV